MYALRFPACKVLSNGSPDWVLRQTAVYAQHKTTEVGSKWIVIGPSSSIEDILRDHLSKGSITSLKVHTSIVDDALGKVRPYIQYFTEYCCALVRQSLSKSLSEMTHVEQRNRVAFCAAYPKDTFLCNKPGSTEKGEVLHGLSELVDLEICIKGIEDLIVALEQVCSRVSSDEKPEHSERAMKGCVDDEDILATLRREAAVFQEQTKALQTCFRDINCSVTQLFFESHRFRKCADKNSRSQRH